jgi:hypothetical protein
VKLLGTIAVQVKGEAILRRPGLWDRIRRAFGGDPDLRTGRMKAALAAEAVVDGVRDALRAIGVSNAVSLVVDELVVFQDREGRPDDLGDLFLAFHEHSAAIGDGFGLLRLAVEHLEAGLHLVLEVQARTEHAASEPAVRLIVSGRLHELEPRPGEDAAAYRARVEPLTRDKAAVDVARLQFESFVARAANAIAAAMPEARVEVQKAEAQIVRPSAKAAPAEPRPGARNYDPYVAYYPSPLYPVLDTLMWVSLFSMWHHPDVVVVNHVGDALGHADSPAVEHAPDPVPAEAGGHDGDHGDAGGHHEHGDAGGDHGDAGGLDGGDAGDAGGFDGGDAGGFDVGDFGGFD